MAEQSDKLYRSRTDRIICGVCGGLAKYFNVDAALIRVLFILLALANGLGVLVYLVLCLMLPAESGEAKADRREKIKEFANQIGDKTKELAKEVKVDVSWREHSRNTLGIIIVVIGVILLLQRVAPFLFSWVRWSVIWPSLVILLGLYLILSKKNS